jgi:hypothetical protein
MGSLGDALDAASDGSLQAGAWFKPTDKPLRTFKIRRVAGVVEIVVPKVFVNAYEELRWVSEYSTLVGVDYFVPFDVWFTRIGQDGTLLAREGNDV